MCVISRENMVAQETVWNRISEVGLGIPNHSPDPRNYFMTLLIRFQPQEILYFLDLSTTTKRQFYSPHGQLNFPASTSKIVTARYQGAWLMVDNGYLCWPTTVPPMKDAITDDDIWFSKWLESMRKDVECAFGILKGRFRILKTGVRVHGVEATDKIWLTCCALHNFVLEADGLNE